MREAILYSVVFLAFLGFAWMLFQCRYDLIAQGIGEPLVKVYAQAEEALALWRSDNSAQVRQRAVHALASAVYEANRLRDDVERPHVFAVTGEDLVRDHLSQHKGGTALFRAYDARRLAMS